MTIDNLEATNLCNDSTQTIIVSIIVHILYIPPSDSTLYVYQCFPGMYQVPTAFFFFLSQLIMPNWQENLVNLKDKYQKVKNNYCHQTISSFNLQAS